MHQKTNINSQIRSMKEFKNNHSVSINYARLIEKQQEVISSLHEEILLLKSYITFHQHTTSEVFCEQSSINTATSSPLNISQKDIQDSLHPVKKSQKAWKEIIQILDLKSIENLDDEMVVDKIRKLKQISQKKLEPIFIERIKEIKMPITIQKIVERIVQKPVEKIVEKIIYIEREAGDDKYSRGHQYRQSDKNEEKTVDSTYSSSGLNRTVSEKNFKKPNQDSSREQRFYKPKYDNKYETKIQPKYEVKYEKYSNNTNTRKPESTGNTLIKKRSEVGLQKYSNYKNDYY